MITEEQVKLKVEQIKKGKLFIDNIAEKYNFDNSKDAVLFFPHDVDDEINSVAFKYYYIYKQMNKIDNTLIVAKADIKNAHYCKAVCDKSDKFEFIDVTDEDIENIIAYYSLSGFFWHSVVVSLTKPDVRCENNGELMKQISLDEKVLYGVYRLYKEDIISSGFEDVIKGLGK